ncbi:Gfo/Idh/MocA family protein [Bacillus horti]|uniref:Dehydrogenase n=1 Tax=Caldalkalibacillus horti TaxID=77523 RepID=A0ABT9W586_9BACI|nr:Gfo/Idh/MocA family oxidoreductase [Bacillus horti]MDQ0168413.1 putative dehydrogenase [Bacillus horti]
MTSRIKIGLIGCGNISSAYIHALQMFSRIELVAVADQYIERAKQKAQEFHIPKAYTVQELLQDSDIELVINLTIPKFHAEVSLAVLEAGKHVYSEKPLALTMEEGSKVLQTANRKDLLVGCAPDTFLGGGLQTCRKLIDDGWIGAPIAASAFMVGHGPEGWHPDPEFFYQIGGGPMFDMGPYYLSALVHLMGPIRRVTGSARASFPERRIFSQPKFGQMMKVETPTHVSGVLDFQNGAIGTMIMSFDVWSSQLPRIEIYGTEGTLLVPDPNTFGGPVQIRRQGEDSWSEMPLSHGFTDNSRGIGVADMAYALQNKRQHRANGELAYHVLEAMHAFHASSDSSKHVELTSTCERPNVLPIGITKENFPFTID